MPVLLIAVENGHAEIVRELLAFGADIDSKDSRDRTALDLAVNNKHPEIQAILQKALDIKLEKY